MNLENLSRVTKEEPKFRLTQINKLIYKDLVDDWNECTVLPEKLRNELSLEVPIGIKHKLFKSKRSETVKALITLSDGFNIESVLMRFKDKRNTVCISTQVGCPMGCRFCATGAMGFKRNLTASEIVGQILLFGRYLKDSKQKVTNVVFMGMGEPFLNYENVTAAINTINAPEKLNLGIRRISVSTAGIPNFIKSFAIDVPEGNLAVSLHAADSKLRSNLMPINNTYPLIDVMGAVDDYLAITNRKVMLEYVLIAGVNDSYEDACSLAKLTKKRLVHVNLIPYNPTGTFKSPSKTVLTKFRESLKHMGVSVTQRYNLGADIHGACGQLTVSQN
jgi:23S rRNA (adenine2503-C2)-methyltransferase